MSTRSHGTATSCNWIRIISACRSALWLHLHDSQAAIPLIKLTSRKVTYLYDLMYAAYDAARMEQVSREYDHVMITEKNGRSKEVVPMARYQAEHYKIRLSAERAQSIEGRLRRKQCHGQRTHQGITSFDARVITLFADQLLRLVG